MRHRNLIAAATAATLGIGLMGAGMANAAQNSKDCVLDVVSGSERCFGDYRKAVDFATNGAITDAPTSAHEAATDPAFRKAVAQWSARRTAAAATAGATPRTAAATADVVAATAAATADTSVIGAVLFTGTNYTGDSDTLRIPRPCVKDGTYDYGFTLGSIGRKAESVQPWANCWIWLHSGSSWDSPRQGPYTQDAPDLGDWKRRAVLVGLS